MAESVKVRFVGTKEQYIAGIPPRDLSAEEWVKIPKNQQEFALESGLYVLEENGSSKKRDSKSQEASK